MKIRPNAIDKCVRVSIYILCHYFFSGHSIFVVDWCKSTTPTMFQNGGATSGMKGYNSTSLVNYASVATKAKPNDLPNGGKAAIMFHDFIKV